MYVEVAYPPEQVPDYKSPAFMERIRKDLEAAGILKPSDKIRVADFIPIRYAYIVYTAERSAQMQAINSFLWENSIQSIGRYGGWEYSFMEEAIMDGKKASEKITEKDRTRASPSLSQ